MAGFTNLSLSSSGGGSGINFSSPSMGPNQITSGISSLLSTSLNRIKTDPTLKSDINRGFNKASRALSNQIGTIGAQTFSTMNLMQLNLNKALGLQDDENEEINADFDKAYANINEAIARVTSEAESAKVDIGEITGPLNEVFNQYRTQVERMAEVEQLKAEEELRAFQATDVESRGIVRFQVGRNISRDINRNTINALEQAGIDKAKAITDVIMAGKQLNIGVSNQLISAIASLAATGSQLYLQHASFVDSSINRKLGLIASMSNTMANLAMQGAQTTAQLAAAQAGTEADRVKTLAQLGIAEMQQAGEVFGDVMGFSAARLNSYTNIELGKMQSSTARSQISAQRDIASLNANTKLRLNEQALESQGKSEDKRASLLKALAREKATTANLT